MRTATLVEKLFVLLVIIVILYIANLACAQEQVRERPNGTQFCAGEAMMMAGTPAANAARNHVAILMKAEQLAYDINRSARELKQKGNARSRSAGAKIAAKKETLPRLRDQGACSYQIARESIRENIGNHDQPVSKEKNTPDTAYCSNREHMLLALNISRKNNRGGDQFRRIPGDRDKQMAVPSQAALIPFSIYRPLFRNEDLTEPPVRMRECALATLGSIAKGACYQEGSRSAVADAKEDDQFFRQFASLFDSKFLHAAKPACRIARKEGSCPEEPAVRKPENDEGKIDKTPAANKWRTARLRLREDDQIEIDFGKDAAGPSTFTENRPLLAKTDR